MENYKNIIKDMTVLIVEDEEACRKRIIPLLRRRFKEVYVAHNGEEGLLLYKEYRPEIVISDIRMPIMNGLEMAHNIHALNPHTGIIFTTAYNDSDYLLEAINTGGEGFIVKPIEVHKLEEALKRVALRLYFDIQHERERLSTYEKMKFKTLSLLIHNIAHYWRQPLSSAVISFDTMAHLFAEGTLTKEEGIGFNRRGQEALMSLSKTIDFFTFMFEMDEYAQEFSLNEAIITVIDMLNPGFQDSHVCIRYELPSSDEKIRNMYHPFCNILVELLVNAYEAYERQEEKVLCRDIIVTLTRDNGYVCVSVKDFAGGLKQREAEHLFEPYITTKAPSKHAGLGLFSVKNTIENFLQGTISYYPLEEGSEFRVVFGEIDG